MKYANVLAFLAFATLSLAKVDLPQIPRGTSKNIVPGAYIVEIDPSNLSSIAGKRSLNPHADFYASMRKRDITWTTTHEYQGDLFTGASLKISSHEDLLQLASINGVKSIHPVHLHPPPKLPFQHTVTGPSDPNIPADIESAHVMTGVDRLHAEGHLGKGIKIAVIDTGVDYTHPTLGGCFGAGCKVASGYDLVGNDYNGTNTPIPNNDPMDCIGHGTHVTGIIGANPGNIYNISGVAYESEIAAYKVFGCTGSVGDDVLIAAFTRAYNEGADIITLSSGGSGGWTSSPASVVASRAAKNGKVVTIAAGNDGDAGMWYASDPADGIDVVSVGSVDNTIIPIQYAKVSKHSDIGYYSFIPLNFTDSLPIYPTSKTLIDNDACDPLPADTPDLSKHVVLIRRGTCSFALKLQNVAAKGAQVALIYNNGGTPVSFDAAYNIPGALIDADSGAYLLKEYLAGRPPVVSFPQTVSSNHIQSPTGGLISSYSSFGPTFDAYLKPSVSAPGGEILSTVPQNMGSWAVYSGTSMATPFIAGVSALLLEAKGASKTVARAARDYLQTTANYIPHSRDETSLLETAAVQGAGLVNAYNMIHYQTVVSPGQLLLNDTANFNGDQQITITNTGSETMKYTLSHKPAGTAQSLVSGSIQQNVWPVPLTSDFATVTMSQSVTISAGQSQTVDIKFNAPTVDPSTIPVYSGFIEVTSDAGEVLSVTYMGIASKLYDAHILDNTNVFFGMKLPTELDAQGNATSSVQTYTFKDDDYPSVLFRLVMGTRSLVFDLVSETATVPNVLTRRDTQITRRHPWRGLLNRARSWLDGDNSGGSYSQIPTIGNLLTWEYNPRHTESTDPGVGYSTFALWNNTFIDGTHIPNGRYKVLLRALKITGDLTNESDYESWLSPVVVFNATCA